MNVQKRSQIIQFPESLKFLILVKYGDTKSLLVRGEKCQIVGTCVSHEHKVMSKFHAKAMHECHNSKDRL